ncbi:hypothetical protein GGU11DRAFT_318736 [Lentinula aff. detonsa]|nr:hypothetical protein GGU11DRAFT_318736 [Lentinula aff. detonsa]
MFKSLSALTILIVMCRMTYTRSSPVRASDIENAPSAHEPDAPFIEFGARGEDASPNCPFIEFGKRGCTNKRHDVEVPFVEFGTAEEGL